ncbi:MAG TPA: ATP-binding cassette domain-containing protein [Acidimicrobiales bacterium]
MVPELEAVNVSAGYGPVQVLHDVSIAAVAGRVHVLLGSNGAGKTTALMTLAGLVRRTSGKVLRRGVPATGPLHKRVRGGVRFVTEQRAIFGSLTTAENLRVGGRSSVREALELFPELEPLLKRPARLLSGGEQQMLVLARALAARPDVLLADELSLGLAPLVVERLLSAVRTAATEQGVAVLLVEQHLRAALRVADYGYVVQRGRVMIEDSAYALVDRMSEIEDAYLSGIAPGNDRSAGLDAASGGRR